MVLRESGDDVAVINGEAEADARAGTDLDSVFELARTTRAASVARRHVADLVPAEIVDDVVLVVSELATNAIRYGGPQIRMTVSRHGATLRVGVWDSGDGVPVLPRDAGERTGPGGRGLLVVSLVAHRWGVEPSDPPPGKTVWIEFDLAGDG